MDSLMEFITNSLLCSKTGPKTKMVANHATNYSYKNCSLCINYFETSSTAIDTPKYKIYHPCVGIYGCW